MDFEEALEQANIELIQNGCQYDMTDSEFQQLMYETACRIMNENSTCDQKSQVL